MGEASTGAGMSLWGLPFTASVVVLTLIVFSRGQAYYWVGWYLGPRLWRSRLGRRIGTGRIERTERLIDRHGVWLVLLAYLNGAIRLVVLVVAGMSRFSVPKQLVASVVGSVLWGFGVAFGLWALLWSWLAVAAVSPVSAVAMSVVVAGLIAWFVVRRRRSRRRHEALSAHPTEPPA